MDYYPTLNESFAKEDKNEDKNPEPVGRIDMMDCSIGDETAYSKMFLNWTRPYYVTDSCEIEINSFTETGDLILLSNDWNGTVFDEYYLIELYTPTYLNTYDVSVGNNQAKLPSVPGIKLYHVDARLAYVNAFKKVLDYCENETILPGSYNIGYAHDNNTYKNPTEFEKNYLYSLVLNHEDSVATGAATDRNLFRFGDVVDELDLNRGGQLNFKFEVTSLGYKMASIKITKK